MTPTNQPRSHRFELDFMRRTLTILREYQGPYDATILINCLLGLLIVPREVLINSIPLDAASGLGDWGISPDSIQHFERVTHNNKNPETIRGVVRSLRNAVAHFTVWPVHRDHRVEGFKFETNTGFAATLTLEELRAFVEKLASHIEQSFDKSSTTSLGEARGFGKR